MHPLPAWTPPSGHPPVKPGDDMREGPAQAWLPAGHD